MAQIDIHRLTFNLSVADQAVAQHVQSRVSDALDRIASELEFVLQRYDDPAFFLTIDRLELQLENLDLAHLEADLLAELSRVLDEEMAERMASVDRPRERAGEQDNRQPMPAHELDIIKHFLATGLALNQTSDLQVTPTRVQKAFYDHAELLDWFLQRQGHDARLRARVLYHLTDREIHALILGRGFADGERIAELIRRLSALPAPGPGPLRGDSIRAAVWQALFRQRAVGLTAFDLSSFITTLAEETSVAPSVIMASLPETWVGRSDEPKAHRRRPPLPREREEAPHSPEDELPLPEIPTADPRADEGEQGRVADRGTEAAEPGERPRLDKADRAVQQSREGEPVHEPIEDERAGVTPEQPFKGRRRDADPANAEVEPDRPPSLDTKDSAQESVAGQIVAADSVDNLPGSAAVKEDRGDAPGGEPGGKRSADERDTPNVPSDPETLSPPRDKTAAGKHAIETDATSPAESGEPLQPPEMRPTANTLQGRRRDAGPFSPDRPSEASPIQEGGELFRQETLPDCFYLHNAGIVLLSPFLGHFFKALGLVREGQFIDSEKQKRAVVLLHYLYPDCGMAEDALILNKLLCGLDLIEPVPLHLKPRASEREEIHELLQSVVHHWTALKDTTVEAFQHNFMNRQARLCEKGDHWHLHVKRESIDVLLDTLPWSIGMIKQPWMPRMIEVEW